LKLARWIEGGEIFMVCAEAQLLRSLTEGQSGEAVFGPVRGHETGRRLAQWLVTDLQGFWREVQGITAC
jgi:hypothetical protein